MICAVMGTAFELDSEDIILFIEDVNEPLYRVNRLLTHLRLAGKLDRLRGVLVGMWPGLMSRRWSGCSPRSWAVWVFRCWPVGAAGIAIRT
jgi:Uncharacterized proteins, homologs of microcin C7 resistance protein MccF